MKFAIEEAYPRKWIAPVNKNIRHKFDDKDYSSLHSLIVRKSSIASFVWKCKDVNNGI